MYTLPQAHRVVHPPLPGPEYEGAWSASCDALVQSILSGRGCCLGSALPGPLYLINVQLVDHRLWYAIQSGQIRHFSIMTGMPIRLSDFKLAPSDQQTHEVHVGDLDLQSLTARCYRSGGFVVHDTPPIDDGQNRLPTSP
jgi:hypothetical protein